MAEAQDTQTLESVVAPERDAASILYPPKVEPVAEIPEPIVETTEPVAETTEPVAETTDDTTDETDAGVAAEEETESPEADQPIGEAETTEEDGETITSFADLIEHQEWDPAWAAQLLIPVKVDGETSEVAMSELVASYQKGEAADKRLEDAKARAATINQGLSQASESVKAQLVEVASVMHLAEQIFGLEAQEANLADLRDSDPTTYLVEKDILAEKRAAIERVKQEATKIFQSASAELSAPVTPEDKHAFQQEQAAQLVDAIPEWKADPKLQAQQAQELTGYLYETYKFTEEQLDNAPDYRLFIMARKAMLYDRSTAKTQAAQHRVMKIPKVMKPGSSRPAAKPPRDHAEVLYGRK